MLNAKTFSVFLIAAAGAVSAQAGDRFELVRTTGRVVVSESAVSLQTDSGRVFRLADQSSASRKLVARCDPDTLCKVLALARDGVMDTVVSAQAVSNPIR